MVIVGKGTYIYALYAHGHVIYVGQCEDLQSRIDQHAESHSLPFDSFTSNFLEDVRPGSEVANTMEAVAIVRLRPQLNSSLPPNSFYSADLAEFCARYNHKQSTIYPLTPSLIEDIIRSRQLKPSYETAGKAYYRITELYALLSKKETQRPQVLATTIGEEDQAA